MQCAVVQAKGEKHPVGNQSYGKRQTMLSIKRLLSEDQFWKTAHFWAIHVSAMCTCYLMLFATYQERRRKININYVHWIF